MTAVIEARNLTKHYGTTLALDRATFTIPAGRIVGLLGPNGAGKTTTLQAILGLTAVAGEVRVLGRDPFEDRQALMEEVCFIADVAILPRWLRVADAVAFVEGVHPRFKRATCEAFLARTQISLSAQVKQLSKGMIVQLHLALILAIDAKILVLDEPTLGLDVLYRKAFYRSLLEDYYDGQRTIVISTHQIKEVEAILTDVIMLRHGQVVLDSAMEDLPGRFAQLQVSTPAAREAARALAPLDERQAFGQSFFIYGGADPAALAPLGTVTPAALSDVFVALMGQGERA